MQVQDPQNEEQDEEAEDDKGLLDELLSGASDDEYDPEEDALAQEPKASRQQSSHEKVEPGGREIGNGHRDTGEEVGRNGQGRADTAHHYGEGARMERRASDPGYLRERREQEVGGARSIAQLHHASGKAPKNFQHRALVVGIAGGQSWLDRTVLKRHFSHFGPVLDVFTPRNTNLAYVAFESDHQLLQALDSPEHFVSGCTVRVKRAEQVPFLCCLTPRRPLLMSYTMSSDRPSKELLRNSKRMERAGTVTGRGRASGSVKFFAGANIIHGRSSAGVRIGRKAREGAGGMTATSTKTGGTKSGIGIGLVMPGARLRET